MNSGFLKAADLQSLLEEVEGVRDGFADHSSSTAADQTPQVPWTTNSHMTHTAHGGGQDRPSLTS